MFKVNNKSTRTTSLTSNCQLGFVIIRRSIGFSDNPFHATGLFLYPLKTENQKFSDVFRGYRKRSVTWNAFIRLQIYVFAGLQEIKFRYGRDDKMPSWYARCLCLLLLLFCKILGFMIFGFGLQIFCYLFFVKKTCLKDFVMFFVSAYSFLIAWGGNIHCRNRLISLPKSVATNF